MSKNPSRDQRKSRNAKMFLFGLGLGASAVGAAVGAGVSLEKHSNPAQRQSLRRKLGLFHSGKTGADG